MTDLIDSAITHPNPLPNPHQRKVELQSALDLTYLQSNISAAARQKLDLHFPPTSSQPGDLAAAPADHDLTGRSPPGVADPLRQRVADLVAAFLARTWEGARHGISINGQDATSLPLPGETGARGNRVAGEEREGVDFEYEPYDPRLNERLARLYGELEHLTTGVSRLRRRAPADAAERWWAAFESGIATEASRQDGEEGRKALEAEQKAEGPAFKLGTMREGWQEDVEDMYRRGVAELERLAGLGVRERGDASEEADGSGSLTETVGKAQRAKMVVAEME